ncbi:MAG: SDR family NAD(P)-dependent oxidoreductase [Verrucomicrobia bacterium]|nr:MAG: SDR family NAD(P)-dependent oxidoreductase [Verrucomicrobiota bacterium]
MAEASEKRVCLVTGASSGIGAAVVLRLHAAGWHVAFTGRREERLAALAQALDPTGERVLPLPGDVRNESDRERWVEATLAKWGRIDVLVNNAGYAQRGPVEAVPLERMRRNFETNVFAAVGLAQLVIPRMRRQKGGRIINIGSVAGRIARPYSAIYDATKHALNAFSDGLRGELAADDIDVVVIEPGYIMTEFLEASQAASGELATTDAGWARLQEKYERAKRFGGAPDDIARLVERAATVPRPRSRYAGPGHAKVLLFLRWLLPDRAFDWLLGVRRRR